MWPPVIQNPAMPVSTVIASVIPPTSLRHTMSPTETRISAPITMPRMRWLRLD